MGIRDRVSAALEAARTAEPQTSTPSNGGLYGGRNAINRDDPPKNDYQKVRQLYRSHPIVGPCINTRAAEVVEPGIRIEANDEDTQQYLRDRAQTLAFYAGERNKPLLPLLWQIARDYDLDGMPCLELVRSDDAIDLDSVADDRLDDAGIDLDTDREYRQIEALKLVDPSTLSFYTEPRSSLLINPDTPPRAALRDDMDFSTSDLHRTKYGEFAAYVQYPDGFTYDRDPVYLSQHDLLRIPRRPDFDRRDSTGVTAAESSRVGPNRGVSIVESVTMEAERWRARMQDYNASIAGMAYPRLQVEFEDFVRAEGSNQEEHVVWNDKTIRQTMNKFDRDPDDQQFSLSDEYKDPGGMFGSPPGINLSLHEGDVPEVMPSLKYSTYVICAGLETPPYAIGFGEEYNRRITQEIETRFERSINAVQRRIGTGLTEIFEHMALIEALDPDGAIEDPTGVRVSIETPPAENPLLDADIDFGDFQSVMQGLKSWKEAGLENDFPAEWVADLLNTNLEEYDTAEDALDQLESADAEELGLTEDGSGGRQAAESDSPTPGRSGSSDTDTSTASAADGGGTATDTPTDAPVATMASAPFTLPPREEFPSDRAFALFKELANRLHLASVAARQGNDPDDVLKLSAWNPALHPRNPETGQFVERPWSVPESIKDLGTTDIIGELAAADPDLPSKVDGLSVDLPDDEERSFRDIVDQSSKDAGHGGFDAPDSPDSSPGSDESDTPTELTQATLPTDRAGREALVGDTISLPAPVQRRVPGMGKETPAGDYEITGYNPGEGARRESFSISDGSHSRTVVPDDLPTADGKKTVHYQQETGLSDFDDIGVGDVLRNRQSGAEYEVEDILPPNLLTGSDKQRVKLDQPISKGVVNADRADEWELADAGSDGDTDSDSFTAAAVMDMPAPGKSGGDSAGLHREEWSEYANAPTGQLKELVRDLKDERDADESNSRMRGYQYEKRIRYLSTLLWYRDDARPQYADMTRFHEDDPDSVSVGTLKTNLRETLTALDPQVGAALMADIPQGIHNDNVDSPRALGQYGRGAVSVDRKASTTLPHELGHSLMDTMGMNDPRYGNNKNPIPIAESGRLPDHRFYTPFDGPEGGDEEAFYSRVRDEWDRMTAGEVPFLSGYATMNGDEFLAVGFGTWINDPEKLEQVHPELAELFEEFFGPSGGGE